MAEATPQRTRPDRSSFPPGALIRRALSRAEAGKTLSLDEAEGLVAARGEDLDRLVRVASGLRELGHGSTITYSRKVFIPLTMLCRDHCHYCTFAKPPARLERPFLSIEEVVAIAEGGRTRGCKEALFTLGDRPEARWRAARDWLHARGYESTVDYLRAAAVTVLEETGLLPHLNPGVLSWHELARLKPVAPSMGMMLETTARRLYTDPGGCHHGSPDKDPVVRLRVLEDAGRLAVPVTTGILVGIGESYAERVDSLFAIRRIARQYGGIQEVIVQNFRAKPDTAMRAWPDAELEAYLATVAVARLVLGPSARVQAPPNLVDLSDAPRLLAAGVDDFGGVSPVTPDHVNPERPWPRLERLAEQAARAGFTLVERLTAHPPYLTEPWLD
ncbi:MAG: 7,8-didemethyl-8-hydroxy-5-deazariboflavin synthase CofG, partial [Actinomycetota bacterium]